MIPFTKPGASETYDVMGAKAAPRRWPTPASTTRGRSRPTSATSMATPPAARRRSTASGLTGIPIINVNNNCSTGSTALFLARQAVESGAGRLRAGARLRADAPGALGATFTDRPSPMARLRQGDDELQGIDRRRRRRGAVLRRRRPRVRRAATAPAARPSPRSRPRRARHAANNRYAHVPRPADASRRCWPRRRSSAR